MVRLAIGKTNERTAQPLRQPQRARRGAECISSPSVV
jgi:hypothetical protein